MVVNQTKKYRTLIRFDNKQCHINFYLIFMNKLNFQKLRLHIEISLPFQKQVCDKKFFEVNN